MSVELSISRSLGSKGNCSPAGRVTEKALVWPLPRRASYRKAKSVSVLDQQRAVPEHPASMTTRSDHEGIDRGAGLLTIGLAASLLNDMEDAIVNEKSIAQINQHQQV